MGMRTGTLMWQLLMRLDADADRSVGPTSSLRERYLTLGAWEKRSEELKPLGSGYGGLQVTGGTRRPCPARPASIE
jgi:hypothetical protein